jgi:hypothetical protein
LGLLPGGNGQVGTMTISKKSSVHKGLICNRPSAFCVERRR